MKEEKLNGGIVNHFEPGSNPQVFNAPISGCVFAMPGANVTQNPAQPSAQLDEQQQDVCRSIVICGRCFTTVASTTNRNRTGTSR